MRIDGPGARAWKASAALVRLEDRMITRLRRVNPVQFALVYALVYALLFFVVAIPVGAIMAAASSSGAMGSMPMMGGFAGGLLFIVVAIVYPALGFVFAFIVGLIGAALYNLVSGWTGGFELILEQGAGSQVVGAA
jgi:hypothetical protein